MFIVGHLLSGIQCNTVGMYFIAYFDMRYLPYPFCNFPPLSCRSSLSIYQITLCTTLRYHKLISYHKYSDISSYQIINIQGNYKRPPVRHVMMVYGVDLPTEIAYTYRISDGNNPGPPILDEIFYEEPCRKEKEVQFG